MVKSTVLLWLVLSQSALAAPAAILWDKWTTHDSASVQTVDHAAWDAFLVSNVQRGANGINRIAYASVSGADKAALADYIASLEAVAVSELNRAEQLAYWINMYNALTAKVVLDHYPVGSIREIKPWLLAWGPWGMKLVRVDGEQLTLNDIEHRILRPIWRDARIHYAVNCASLGCPNLQARAFTAAICISVLIQEARTSSAPRKINGKPKTLFTWFG